MKLEGFLIFKIWNLEFSPQKKKKMKLKRFNLTKIKLNNWNKFQSNVKSAFLFFIISINLVICHLFNYGSSQKDIFGGIRCWVCTIHLHIFVGLNFNDIGSEIKRKIHWIRTFCVLEKHENYSTFGDIRPRSSPLCQMVMAVRYWSCHTTTTFNLQ